MQPFSSSQQRSSSPRFPVPADDEYRLLYANKEFRIYQDAIERLKTNEDQLPSLPTVTLEMRKAMSDPDISPARLAAMIARDPGLTAILMKHASSAAYRTTGKPRNLQDVITRLGMRRVDSVVLAHSVRSLFVLKSPSLRNLYKKAWHRQTLKACTSYHLARQLGLPDPDHALVASLLSEVGTLAMLAALQQYDAPTEQSYRVLCRHYSKHLGMILLAKWGMDKSFTDILRQTGQWAWQSGSGLQLIDAVNLALFHTIHYLNEDSDLISIEALAAYQKLVPPFNMLGKSHGLQLVEENFKAIEAMTSLFTAG